MQISKWVSRGGKSTHCKGSVSYKSVVSSVCVCGGGGQTTLRKPVGTATQPHNLYSSFLRERQNPGQWETTSKLEQPGIQENHHYQVGHLFLLAIWAPKSTCSNSQKYYPQKRADPETSGWGCLTKIKCTQEHTQIARFGYEMNTYQLLGRTRVASERHTNGSPHKAR